MAKVYDTDIAIIGAGPSGLFSVFQAGMLSMKCVVIDVLDQLGGQCATLYPQKPIYDIPAYSKIYANQLVDKLDTQARLFNPEYLLSQLVVSVKKIEGLWEVLTSKDNVVRAKAIIIAAGAGAFGPNKPPIAGIEQFENSSVFYYIQDINRFKDKNIVIAGGGDSAIDWALALSEVANKIYIVHRRNKFKAAPQNITWLRKLAEEKKIVEFVTPYQLYALEGSGPQLQKVIVQNLDGEQRGIHADTLLPFFGLSMDLGPILSWGLNLEKKHIVVTPDSMETSIDGIFAIGDIITYPGKLKLILTGFAEAALACHKAYHIVYPDSPLHFEYSTTKGLPV